jgi:hypothetical protein
LAGVKNGALLEAADFDVIVTTDQEIPFQQNLEQRRIAPLILCVPTNRLADLKALGAAAIASLDKITAGAVIRID